MDPRWSTEEPYGWVPDAVRSVDRRQRVVLLNVAINVALALYLLVIALYWLLLLPAVGLGLNHMVWRDNVAHRRWLIGLYRRETGKTLGPS
jgi:hypothetical protein